MIEAEIRQTIYSSVDGQAGSWALRTQTALGAVPREGDSIVFDYGESQICETVRRVFFYAGGKIDVELRSVITDNPDVLHEMAHRVKAWGWEKIGGPWAAQGAG